MISASAMTMKECYNSFMAKGGGKVTTNLLRVSGIIFLLQGAMHFVRSATGEMPRLFVLTTTGSLLYALCLLALAFACFKVSK